MIEPQQKPAGGRRRFLGAGTALTPAVLTLMSRPALGQTLLCVPPSQALSANASAKPTTFKCDGVSPGNYWKQTTPNSPPYHWPEPPYPIDTLGSIFTGCFNSTFPASMKLVDALGVHQAGGDPYNFAFHLIGAYLNVVNDYVDVITLPQIRGWWCDWIQSSMQTVKVGGVDVSAAWFVSYLRGTGISP